MKEFGKYSRVLFPPDMDRLSELAQRAWRIYINPPKESKISADLESVPITYKKEFSISTSKEPKQVVVINDKKLALVSCMKGKKIQFFDYSNNKISQDGEITLPDQCVEVSIKDNICFATTTNFLVYGNARNTLWLIDINHRKVISSLDTGGNWSKIVALNPTTSQAFVSNWQSNSLSIIDIQNVKKPKLSQEIKFSPSQLKCPRGIAFKENGRISLITGFYSGNIAELRQGMNGKWEVVFISPPFDQPHYHGNMRHVIVSSNGETAIISNKGRNLLHTWSIPNRQFVDSIQVGKAPNTIAFSLENPNNVLVSCSGSNTVCSVDIKENKIVGKSKLTGKMPTGLCATEKGFLVTNFKSNTLEKFTN